MQKMLLWTDHVWMTSLWDANVHINLFTVNYHISTLLYFLGTTVMRIWHIPVNYVQVLQFGVKQCLSCCGVKKTCFLLGYIAEMGSIYYWVPVPNQFGSKSFLVRFTILWHCPFMWLFSTPKERPWGWLHHCF
jgi:hypothetical protein